MTKRKPTKNKAKARTKNKAKTTEDAPNQDNPAEDDERLDDLLVKLRNAAYGDGNPIGAAIFELARSCNLSSGDDHHRARAAALKAIEQAGLR